MRHSFTDILCSICCCIPIAADEIYEKEYKETQMSMMKAKRSPPLKMTMCERFISGTTHMMQRFSKDLSSKHSKRYQLRSSYSPKTLANKIKSTYSPELETIPSASGKVMDDILTFHHKIPISPPPNTEEQVVVSLKFPENQPQASPSLFPKFLRLKSKED